MRAIWSYAGLAVALLVAALLIVPGFLDWSRYAGLIEDRAEAVTGRDVEIEGAVRISLLPTPTLRVGRLTIANLPEGSRDSMLEVEEVTAELGLGALVRGDLEISEMVLKNPRLVLETLPDGKSNWHFDHAPEATPAESGAEGAEGGPATAISIGRLRVEHGEIEVRDVGIAGEATVTGVEAELSAASLRGPFRAQGQGTLDGEALTFRLGLGEIIPGKAYPANADISTAGVDVELRGIVTGAEDEMRFDGAAGAKLAPTVSPELAALTGGEPLAMEMALIAGATEVNVRELKAEGGPLALQGGFFISRSSQPSVSANLRINRLDLGALSAAGHNVSPEAVAGFVGEVMAWLPEGAHGDVELIADTVGLTGAEASESQMSLALTGEGIEVTHSRFHLPGDSELAVTGFVATGEEGPYFTGAGTLTSPAPKPLATWYGGGAAPYLLSATPLQTLRVESNLFLTGRRAAFDKLSAEIDGGTLKGQAGFTFADRPEVNLSLEGEGLVLPVLGLPLEAFALEPGGAVDPGFSGRFNLKGKNITISGAALAAFQAVGEAVGKQISVSELSLRTADGASATLSGAAGEDEGVPAGSVQATINAPETGNLAELFGLAPARFAPLAPVSLTAQARWPVVREAKTPPATPDDIAPAGNEESGVAQQVTEPRPPRSAVAVSLLGRAAQAQIDIAGTMVPGERGLEDPDLDLAVEVSAGDWQSLARMGGAAAGLELPPAPEIDPDGDGAPGLLSIAVRGKPQTGVATAGTLSLGAFIADFAAETRWPNEELRNGERDYAAEISASTTRAAALAEVLGIDARGVTAFDVSGMGRFEDGRLEIERSQVNLTGSDEARLSAAVNGAMETGASPPAGTWTVDATELSLDLFADLLFGPAPAAEAGDDAAPDGDAPAFVSAWDTQAFDLGFMQDTNLSVGLKSGTVTAGPVVIENAAALLNLAGGTLTVSEASGEVFDGRIRMDGTLGTASGAQVDVTLRSEGVQIARLADALTLGEIGTGRLDGRLALKGAGLSELALVSSLQGEGELRLGDSRLAGFDLQAFANGLGELETLDGFGALADATLENGHTRLDRFDSKVTVENGVMRLTDLRAATEGAKETRIDAYADLGRKALDLETGFELAALDGAPPVEIVVTGKPGETLRSVNRVELEAYAARELLKRDVDALVDGGGSPELRELLGLDKAQESATR